MKLQSLVFSVKFDNDRTGVSASLERRWGDLNGCRLKLWFSRNILEFVVALICWRYSYWLAKSGFPIRPDSFDYLYGDVYVAIYNSSDM